MTLEEEGQDIPGEQSHYLTNGVPYSPARTRPMIHPCLDPPLCEDCQKLELSFFDPDCPGCRKILNNSNTKVPEIYAILRQWTPQTQQNLELLVNEVNILMMFKGRNVQTMQPVREMYQLCNLCVNVLNK